VTNPKPLPEQLGERVPMLNRYGFFVRAGYPFGVMRPLDYFIVPDRLRTPEMVRQAVCRRAKRHGETFQTKRTVDGIMVIRIA
jgi:hypothetical protein